MITAIVIKTVGHPTIGPGIPKNTKVRGRVLTRGEFKGWFRVMKGEHRRWTIKPNYYQAPGYFRGTPLSPKKGPHEMINYQEGDQIQEPSSEEERIAIQAYLDDHHFTVVYGTVVSMHDFKDSAKPKATNCRKCA